MINQIDEASQISLQKAAQPIIVKVLNLDEIPNDNDIITMSNDESSEFSIEPYTNSKNEKNSPPSYNMLLSIDENTTITNINFLLKLDSIGIKGVVVILIYNQNCIKLENYEQFNDFDLEKYNQYKENDTLKSNDYEICYFEFYENQIEIHLELPVYHLVKFMMLKFIKSKDNILASSTAKSINITNFRTLGCKHDEFKLYEELKKSQKQQMISSDQIVDNRNKTTILVNRVLWFLCQLAEQNKSQNLDEDQSKFLNFHDFDITNLWKIYDKAQEIDSKNNNHSSFNLRIPILILLYQLVNCNEIKHNNEISRSNNLNQEKSYQSIFEKLCEIIDKNDCESSNDNEEEKKILRTITREILKNGLMVFFPSENERKDYFMFMIQENSNISFQKTSTKLIFEAFCNLFCTNKTNLIQNLLTTNSTNMFESESDCSKIIDLIDKIIRMGFFLNGNEKVDNTEEINQQDRLLNALNELLNSIQSHLYYNIKESLDKMNSKSVISLNINSFVTTYAQLLIEKCKEIINLVLNNQFMIEKFQNFLNKIIYNFVLWLTEIFNQLDTNTCTNLVEILIDFHKLFLKIQGSLDQDDLESTENEKVLKTWTFNSKSRSTITDISIQYSYPLANKFIIEFDANSSLPSNESSSELV